MERLEMAKGLQELFTFFDRKMPSKEALEMWFKKLKWVDKRDFEVAIDAFTSKDKAHNITPAKILEYADTARARRSHNEKQKDKVEAKKFFDPSSHNTEIGKECVKFIDQIYQLRGPASWEFEMSWAKAMMRKYSSDSETARGFRDMMLSAKRKLDEYYSHQNEKEVVNG